MSDDAERAEAAARELWQAVRFKSDFNTIERMTADALLTFAAQAAQRENEACAELVRSGLSERVYESAHDGGSGALVIEEIVETIRARQRARGGKKCLA